MSPADVGASQEIVLPVGIIYLGFLAPFLTIKFESVMSRCVPDRSFQQELSQLVSSSSRHCFVCQKYTWICIKEIPSSCWPCYFYYCCPIFQKRSPETIDSSWTLCAESLSVWHYIVVELIDQWNYVVNLYCVNNQYVIFQTFSNFLEMFKICQKCQE